jgi:hypothetical protein
MSIKRLVFTILLVGILPLSADASLQFDKEARHAALWRRIYDPLPAGWKCEQTIVVRDVPYAELNDGDENEEHSISDVNDGDEPETMTDGAYEPVDEESAAPASIRLLNTLDDEEAGLVFAHEYAHFIWDEQLTRAQRQNYRRIWQRQKRADSLVTEYASEDPTEGFAEAVSYFLRKPAVLRARDEKSWQFVLQLSKTVRSSEP